MDSFFTTAITRRPGNNFAQGLTTSNLGTPDYEVVLKQHAAYIDTLKFIGLEVVMLDEERDYPDAHFVEDTAVVTPDIAVISRPGATARQGEENTIAPVLGRYRKTARIVAPGTLDGGDVIMVGNHFFIGLSERTNENGARQLGKFLEKYGHTWQTVQVGAGLHLKSSINYLGNNVLLSTEEFASKEVLKKYDKITVNAGEEYAANTLWINDHLITPAGYSATRTKLEAMGMKIIELDMSEVRKMDGGLTCLSLRF
jgi:dimethylargininase